MRLFRHDRRAIPVGLQRLLLCFLFFSSYHLYAQTSQVSGTVRDSAGGPLAGATVTVKGNKTGTTTSGEGTFTITARSNDILNVSAVGYETKEVPVGGQSNITVS